MHIGCFACMYVCGPTPLPGACGDQKRVLDTLELEWQKIASHRVHVRNWTWVLCKSSQWSYSLSHLSRSLMLMLICTSLLSWHFWHKWFNCVCTFVFVYVHGCTSGAVINLGRFLQSHSRQSLSEPEASTRPVNQQASGMSSLLPLQCLVTDVHYHI